MATSAPTYIYKIVPADSQPPRPLPDALPVSALDSRDGYIHASTAAQLLGTLRRFFATEAMVYVLRLEYARLAPSVRWEQPDGTPGGPGKPGCFPHLYNGLRLGKDEVEAVGEWRRGGGSGSAAQEGVEWGPAGWPFGDVDVPQP